MEGQDCINFLKEKLENDTLPGMDVLAEMAPIGRQLTYPVKSDYIDSAVAILLYKNDKELFFPLIKRTSHNQNDKHKGQISFPGGRYDKNDNTLLNCALRETEEELGIDKSNLTPLGKLTKLYIPISNYMVQPFVFIMNNNNGFTAQESEVEYILEIKLKDLFKEKNIKKGQIELENGNTINNIPYFSLNNHVIWGATAMILNEFKNVASGFKTK